MAMTFALLAGPASALEEAKDEKDKLRACEVNVCGLVVKKAPATGNLQCAVAKTWHRDRLKEGSATGKVSWTFGDARCTVDLSVPRAAVIEALKAKDGMLQLPEHTVTCEIEREKGVSTVVGRLAPKAQFADGQVKKVWINLKKVDGPTTMKGLAYAVAKLEDTTGIFHKPLVNAINTFLTEKCPKTAAGK